jgi:hypothetical protein
MVKISARIVITVVALLNPIRIFFAAAGYNTTSSTG